MHGIQTYFKELQSPSTQHKFIKTSQISLKKKQKRNKKRLNQDETSFEFAVVAILISINLIQRKSEN
jgi:hypothetical protein